MTVEFLYFYILRRRKSLSIFGPDALPQACPFGLLFVEIIKKERSHDETIFWNESARGIVGGGPRVGQTAIYYAAF